MAARSQTDSARPGDLLLVVHGFQARSPDELSLARGDRIELIERDDDFGDGWFLGRNTETGDSGLFPEVYTRPAPKPTITAALHQRAPSQPSAQSAQHVLQPVDVDAAPTSAPLPLTTSNAPTLSEPTSTMGTSTTGPLQISPTAAATQADATNRASIPSQSRGISQTLSGEVAREETTISSPVMHETLSVIDEHITDMSTPRHSATGKELRPIPSNDSGSEYSSHHRLSYINGQETEEEEHNFHTEQEVMKWSPMRVAEYLEDVGVEKKHCDIFREQEINGEALLSMDQATIFLKEFELGPVGPRLRTWVKIKALQQEVKNANDAARAMAAFDGPEESAVDPARIRATSMSAVLPPIPSLRDGQATKGFQGKQTLPRAHSTAGHSTLPSVEATSPLTPFTPASPTPGTPTRPSAASVRSLNHSRRHSSIDSTMNMPTPTSAGAMKLPLVAPATHKKTPSFDRGWKMGSPQSPSTESKRPSSSHYGAPTSPEENEFGRRTSGISQLTAADLDRGYFSGGEVDNRKARNVLRKRESPSHSRNPSFSTEAGRRAAYNRRHSRIGSADSATGGASSVSSAARAYFGSSISHRSSSNFEFVRPLKHMNDVSPTVTKLPEYNSPSIDAIANSPRIPASEASSQGRASPSPAAAAQSHSFFSKKSRGIGLRAISDAVTGTERANVSSGDITASPIKESPMQSPTRTGSSTPSATSNSKSFDLENPELNKRSTGSSVSKDGKKRSKKHSTSAYLRGRQQITPQEAMEGCDYSGWMKKKSSSLMTTWKTRLFVLRGRRLSYFYTENDTEEKGLIDISSHRVLPANNERITGFHATITRATSSPSSPQGATIPTAASAASNGIEEDMSGMFIFKLVPPRAGLQRGVQFTKPIVHYFAVDSIQVGRLWMAALMKATIDRDDSLSVTTTYQQKTISLEKARAMRQRPPALMDDDDTENASLDMDSKQSTKESIQESVIHEEDEKQGLAISGLDDAKALLDYAENGAAPEPQPPPKTPNSDSPKAEHKRKPSITPGLVSIG